MTTARYSHLAPETMLNAADAMANATGLGVTPTPAPVAPAPAAAATEQVTTNPSNPLASTPVIPALRLVGKEDMALAQGVERQAA